MGKTKDLSVRSFTLVNMLKQLATDTANGVTPDPANYTGRGGGDWGGRGRGRGRGRGSGGGRGGGRGGGDRSSGGRCVVILLSRVYPSLLVSRRCHNNASGFCRSAGAFLDGTYGTRLLVIAPLPASFRKLFGSFRGRAVSAFFLEYFV